jgi:CRP-like cAMP-binding protein
MVGTAQKASTPFVAGKIVSESEANRRVALVQRSPLFEEISAEDCREIVSAAQEKRFARRDTLFLEGDPVRQVILLTSGTAKVVQFGKNGTEVILALRGPGDVVGTMALRSENHHCAMAQTMAPATALVWDATVFEAISRRYLTLRTNITCILCQQLHELEQRFREISTEKVSVRLSNQLIRLLNQVGHRANGRVEIRLSREELAQLTGTTLFTVSRLLSDWNARGIVTTGREAVSVHNFQGLMELTQSE